MTPRDENRRRGKDAAGGGPTKDSPTVGDLIEARTLRTVVQLADISESSLYDRLVEDFVVTSEVGRSLRVIFDALRAPRGSGFFLQGSYGSGKSHFLVTLHRFLTDPEAARKVGAEIEREPPPSGALVVPLSLVEHRSEMRLEDAVARAVAVRVRDELDVHLWPSPTTELLEEIRARIRRDYATELREFLASPDGRGLDEQTFFRSGIPPLALFVDRYRLPWRLRFDRDEFWGELSRALASGPAPRPLVLLIDELSEFLRSKPDARSFNEDIRFLQFLGEAGERMALWVVASLQEWIEETGEIRQETFNKIKDRYPARLVLSGAHLGELVRRRLAPKKPGAEVTLDRLYRELRGSVSDLDFGRSEFIDLYPVHPATIRLLDDLRSLFSQHRGAIDFLNARIAGDPRRDIAGLIDEPADTLVTPDRILDHFTDRIRETVEYQPYLDVVHRYWRQEAERILPDPLERAVGMRSLAVLILAALAPVERQYPVRRLASMLLHRITKIDARANAEHLREVLARMTRDGAYLEQEPSNDPLDDVFRVKLEADVNVLISRKLRAAEKDAVAEGPLVLRKLKGLLTDPALPLADWRELEPSEVEVRWQNTSRSGFFVFADPIELGRDRFHELFAALRVEAPDFLFVVVPPWRSSETEAWIAERLAPLLDDATGLAVRFWVPGMPQRLEPLAPALGRALLLERTRSDAGPLAERMADRLREQLESESGRVREFVRDLYSDGMILTARGGDDVVPRSLGMLAFDALLERVTCRALDARYPKHRAIAPRTEVPLLPRLDPLIEAFFRGGQLSPAAPRIDRTLVEAYLVPLGLARKSREGIALHADPQRSPPLRELLDNVGEAPKDAAELERSFRKGPSGMALEPYRLLLLAGAFSGQIRLLGDHGPLRLEELRGYHLSKIRSVARGEILGEREQEEIRSLFFIEEKLRRRQPFSNPLQEELWERAKEFRRETETELGELEGLLGRKGEFPALGEAGFDAAAIAERQARLSKLIREIKLSYPSREGLRAFLVALREEPYFEEIYFELQDALEFLRGPVDGFLRAVSYARQAKDVLSGAGSPWEEASLALRDLEEALTSIPPHRPESRTRRDAAFEAFLGIYIPLYRTEHDRTRSPARFAPYRDLLAARAFRILEAFADVERLSAGNELVTLRRRVDAVLREECAALSVDALRVTPICECSFRPSSTRKAVLPTTAEILEEAEKAVDRVLAEIGSAEYRERIAAHVHALESVGRSREARGLEDLLRRCEAGIEGARGEEETLPRTIRQALRDALGGKVVSVDRSLADLDERLAGRSFSRDKLLTVVEDWIRGDDPPEPDVLIRVTGAPRGAAETAKRPSTDRTEAALTECLAERSVELARDIASGALSPESLPLLLWADELDLTEGRLDALPGISLPPVAKRDAVRRIAREIRDARPELFADCGRRAEGALLAEEDWNGVANRLGLPPSSGDPRHALLRSSVLPGFQAHLAAEIAHAVLQGGSLPEVVRSLHPDAFPAAGPLRELVRLERSRRRLETGEPPRQPEEFEESLRGDLGDVLYHLAVLEGLSAERGVELDLDAARGLADRTVERHASAFAEILERGDALDVLRIESLEPTWFRPFVRSHPAEEVLRILVDGMRWDLWRYLREHFLPSLASHYRILGETFTWARLPTTTEHQVRRLLDPRPGGELLPAARIASREEYLRRRSAGGSSGAEGMVVKLDFIDHKVHTFREPMYEFYRECRVGAEIHLQGLLESLPPRSLVLLFADHGFRENPAFRGADRYETTRYTHGEGHFLEVLAPAIAILKASGG